MPHCMYERLDACSVRSFQSQSKGLGDMVSSVQLLTRIKAIFKASMTADRNRLFYQI